MSLAFGNKKKIQYESIHTQDYSEKKQAQC